MKALSLEVQKFLDSVALVSELEASDAALVEAGRTLWDQLTRAEDMEWTEIRDRAMRKLGLVGQLRGQIAMQIADIRSRESLQILGDDPATRSA